MENKHFIPIMITTGIVGATLIVAGMCGDSYTRKATIYPVLQSVDLTEISAQQVETETEPVTEVAEPEPTESIQSQTVDYWQDGNADTYHTPEELRGAGAIYWNGIKFTYYTQSVLPGEGLGIPGRYVDENGLVCDGDGYICLGTSMLELPRGTVVMTLFGRYGKVYDYGYADENLFDVYTDW